ncbi:PREDICTED: uncharacterized protein LOC102818460 [Chrysochloris asiatica]|uniref:Uncharacterized protein LOC102818460 n=1 Tax=Chrysochloris asiatica TaxID=185453 RepID=A0A9B0WK88_CHRAS|nr:PREDICTED: uncharacterized protein LOC102818460 [Chrysochloris asiatica]
MQNLGEVILKGNIPASRGSNQEGLAQGLEVVTRGPCGAPVVESMWDTRQRGQGWVGTAYMFGWVGGHSEQNGTQCRVQNGVPSTLSPDWGDGGGQHPVGSHPDLSTSAPWTQLLQEGLLNPSGLTGVEALAVTGAGGEEGGKPGYGWRSADPEQGGNFTLLHRPQRRHPGSPHATPALHSGAKPPAFKETPRRRPRLRVRYQVNPHCQCPPGGQLGDEPLPWEVPSQEQGEGGKLAGTWGPEAQGKPGPAPSRPPPAGQQG